MIAALPRELAERHLGLRAVREADDHGLLQHAKRSHLAGHAAASTALRLARRVHAWQIAAQLLVRRELVQQAALEAATIAEQPVVRQRHVLGLRHLHRDRLELPYSRPA